MLIQRPTSRRRALLNLRRIALRMAFGIVAAAIGACSGTPAPAPEAGVPPGGVVLTGAGSTFSSVLFARWFTAYHARHPTTVVKYDAVGSGEGVRRFIGRNLKDGETVDFGASDSAMSDAQLAEAGDGALMIPVTGGCVAQAYHLPDLKGQLRLSRTTYAAIFLGEVNRWNDARIVATNPGVTLPDLPIGRVVRQDSSGTTFAFASHLAAIDGKWRGQFRPATQIDWPRQAIRGRGNEGVAGLIRNYNGAIGYVGYEFARRIGLEMAALENKEGQFVQPSAESCAAGLATANLPENLRAFVPDPSGAGSYPIVTFSWVLLRKAYADPAIAAALRDLFTWCLEEGQAYAAELGYVPLPPAVAESALKALSAGSLNQASAFE
jgi:phosphate transport system substrate-binding protein